MTRLRHGVSIVVGSLFVFSLMGTSHPLTPSSSIPTDSMVIRAHIKASGNTGIISTFAASFYGPVALSASDEIFVTVGNMDPILYEYPDEHHLNDYEIVLAEGDEIKVSLMRSSEEEGFNDAPNSTITVPPLVPLVTDVLDTPYPRDAIVDLAWNTSDYEELGGVSTAGWSCTDMSDNVTRYSIPMVHNYFLRTAQLDLSAGISSIEDRSPGATSGGCEVSVWVYATSTDYSMDPALFQPESYIRLTLFHTTTIAVSAL